MRPDKKKKVHHDSRKKAEKAKQTTLSEQGQTKESVEKVQDVVGAKDDGNPPQNRHPQHQQQSVGTPHLRIPLA